MLGDSRLRNKEFDIVRGIGIILVVCGHIGVIRRFAYLFHVPLFFFTSGYFFNRNRSLFDVVAKAIKRYYIPFVLSELIFMLFHNCLAGIIGYEAFSFQDVQRLIPVVLGFQNVCARLGQLWFLLALFSVSILYYVFVRIFSKKGVVLILVSMFLLHFFIYEKTNIFDLEVCALYEIILVMSAIYGIGNIYKKYERKLEGLISSKLGMYIALALLVMLTKIPLSSYDVRTNYYENTLVAFMSMLGGVYFSLSFARNICSIRIVSDFFALAGQYSIWILVGQSVLYKVIIIMLEHRISLGWIKVIQLCTAVAVPLILAILFEYLKKCVVGFARRD